MTDGSSSWPNSESDQLRLLGGPPTTNTIAFQGLSPFEGMLTGLPHSCYGQPRYGLSKGKEVSQRVGKGGQWGRELVKPPGSVLRGTMSTHAQLCYLRGRYSDSLDHHISQDSCRFWLSFFLSTTRVAGCEHYKIVRFGLAFVSYTPHGQKLTRAHTHSLNPNSDACFTESISV